MTDAQITANAGRLRHERTCISGAGLLVLRIVASVVLLGVVLWWVEWSTVIGVLRSAHVGLLVLLLGLFLGERFFIAYRWHVLIRAQTSVVPYSTTVKVTFLSGFLGSFMPGAVGMEAIRIAGLARSTSDLAGAFSSVLVDRLLGFLALLAIVLAVVPLAPAEASGPVVLWSALLLCCMLFGFAAMTRVAEGSGSFFMLPAGFAQRVREKLLKLVHSLRELKRNPRTLLWAAALAIAFQFVRVLISPLTAMALGLDIPLIYFFMYVPIIVFLSMLPFSVGGLGVREAGFVYFFGTALTSPEGAFAISIIIYIMGLLSCLPGAVVLAAGFNKGGSVAGAVGAE